MTVNINYSQVPLYLDEVRLTRKSRDKKTIDCDQIISLLQESVKKNKRINWQIGEALVPYKGDKKLLRPFLQFCGFSNGSVDAILRSLDQRLKRRNKMLVDITIAENHPISRIIAEVNGNSPKTIRHKKGVYEIGHFSFDYCIANKVEDCPELESLSGRWFSAYGVCDSYQQILEKCPELHLSERKFVIAITPIVKANQSPQGGWRWHKWGPYIGTHKTTVEYLYDEPKIDKVYVYHIYKILED